MKERAIKETITQQTEILRNSKESMVIGIRRCLEEKNINTKKIIVAEWFPDDASFEFGIVVTDNDEVYQFGYNYIGKLDGEGSFSEWENITHTWKNEPLSKSIEIALKENEKNT